MGKLVNRIIKQIRSYKTPNSEPIPNYDYDNVYPNSVYDAIHRTMEDDSTTLTDELSAIYRLINEKQPMIEAGVSGKLMAWTGVKGQIGSIDIATSISNDAAARSNYKVVSERAVGAALDMLVNSGEFNEHIGDRDIHIDNSERLKWNNMAPKISLDQHTRNEDIHVTPEEKAAWSNKADSETLENHLFNTNNPHNVDAHQAGTYTRNEIDDMFGSIRESFFNYRNIEFDDRTNTAKLVQYNPAYWNPNYVLAYGDDLPEVTDPSLTYFAIKPIADYAVAESTDVCIYIKKPGLTWQEVGLHAMSVGDMVIRYPDTVMCVWVQGRFMSLFTDSSPTGGSVILGDSSMLWRPQVSLEGILSWTKSSETAQPDPVTIRGPAGYTPIKGIDYHDGADGIGIPAGGVENDILIKTDGADYETAWKSFANILEELVQSGTTLPRGLVLWENIVGTPKQYNDLGDNDDGFVVQKVITDEIDKLNAAIQGINDRIDGVGGLGAITDALTSHINSTNNPHRVTAASIGAVGINAFTDHVLNVNNPHGVTKAQLQLDRVDNTSDIEKPISTAVQTVIDEINRTLSGLSDDVGNNNFVGNVLWDNSQCKLTFVYRDGTDKSVILPILDIFRTITYDKVAKQLVLITPDGAEHRIDITDLITQYDGTVSDNIEIEVIGDKIKGTIISNSVTGDEIQNSVALRGTPTATTVPPEDNSSKLATTEFVKSVVVDSLRSHEVDRPLSANQGRLLNQDKADLTDIVQLILDMSNMDIIDNLESTDSHASLSANMGRYINLTKAPRVHTSPSGATFGRATAELYGHARASNVDPLMDGTSFKGTDDGYYAMADHRHPRDISRAPLNWPDVEYGMYQLEGEPRSTLPPDSDNSNWIATTEWVRRNATGCVYGICKTNGDDAHKVVELKNSYAETPTFVRQIGSMVAVLFDHTDTSTDELYLNVQNTGEAKIIFGGAPIPNKLLKSNYLYILVYDGQYWQVANGAGGSGTGIVIDASQAYEFTAMSDEAITNLIYDFFDSLPSPEHYQYVITSATDEQIVEMVNNLEW